MDFVFRIRVLIRETFIIIEVALSTTIIFSQYSHNVRLFYLFVISQTRDNLLFCVPVRSCDEKLVWYEISIANWFELWHRLICMCSLYMPMIAWWFGIVAWLTHVRYCADWLESSCGLGLGHGCVFVHVQVLLEAERGWWQTETRFRRTWGFGTKFMEELRSYRSRMSCETFRLESNVREDDHSVRRTWKMCRLWCGVCLSRL
jgi:hypothetical protein